MLVSGQYQLEIIIVRLKKEINDLNHGLYSIQYKESIRIDKENKDLVELVKESEHLRKELGEIVIEQGQKIKNLERLLEAED